EGAVQLTAHGPLEQARHRLAIVDPDTRAAVAPGKVGEIWAKGAGLATGYYSQPDPTAATFQARTADGDGPWLRTGDLGFEHNGALYLSGRARNLLIVRGRNVHLEDVEDTVADAAAGYQPTGIAVAAAELDHSEQLIAFVES